MTRTCLFKSFDRCEFVVSLTLRSCTRNATRRESARWVKTREHLFAPIHERAHAREHIPRGRHGSKPFPLRISRASRPSVCRRTLRVRACVRACVRSKAFASGRSIPRLVRAFNPPASSSEAQRVWVGTTRHTSTRDFARGG